MTIPLGYYGVTWPSHDWPSSQAQGHQLVHLRLTTLLVPNCLQVREDMENTREQVMVGVLHISGTTLEVNQPHPSFYTADRTSRLPSNLTIVLCYVTVRPFFCGSWLDPSLPNFIRIREWFCKVHITTGSRGRVKCWLGWFLFAFFLLCHHKEERQG